MKDCDDCFHSDIVDWEQDIKTGRATAIYWCEIYGVLCSEIQECEHIDKIEEDL